MVKSMRAKTMKDRILEQRLRKVGFKYFEVVEENSEYVKELGYLELKYLIDILPFAYIL